MATSLTPVELPRNTWVDIYDATGILAGTQVIIQNTGSSEVDLTESATQPGIDDGTLGINKIPPRVYFTNLAANVGAWAYSQTGSTLQVEVV